MGVLPFNDLLQAHGYNTLQSVDGADTVELARKHHPDLVVMDIQLPKVSGLDRTKELKADADLKDIPVLAVTAFALDGGIERILDAGCEDAIGKPISVPLFLETVEKHLL
ncbi:MAG: response regulator [Rhodospirillaceae bacterium]|jgi:two-component system, cell cycle response regulator DivK|nr:response regulator [Rhodospirillaceae bacterium]MBT5245054.1 response regulator [Rhodospirillaceae bacterium]MBT5561437.1 response regulator [Rhodospirillaceae bacterium]MBT6241263.1 response regulator [Rhodospirillaceae bacterium]MBT7137424.1 response regulator [Rhodospirillaceae bacterium]